MTTEPMVGSGRDTTEDAATQLLLAMYRLTRSLRRAGRSALSPTQLIVLAQLATSGPMRIGELASQVPCSQPTATIVINGFVSDGLVHRVPDETDGRATRVRLTDTGMASLESLVQEESALLAPRLAALEPAERAAVLAAIPVLARLTESSRG